VCNGGDPNHRAPSLLRMLARCPNGCAEALLMAYGFSIRFLADVVFDGLAAAGAEHARAGGREVIVVWIKITEKGRRQLRWGERIPLFGSAPTKSSNVLSNKKDDYPGLEFDARPSYGSPLGGGEAIPSWGSNSMDWIKHRYSTIIEAFTAKRVLVVGTIVAAATATANFAPRISWGGNPMLLNVPSWAWGTIAALIVALYFVFEYAHRKRMDLVPKFRLFFDQNDRGIVHTPTIIQRIENGVLQHINRRLIQSRSS
jgi:hypothetical protein